MNITKKIRLTRINNKSIGAELPDISIFDENAATQTLNYHKSFPGYSPTPLVSLKDTAEFLGVADIFVKDESYRFGLNAFKVLGGSYAAANYIAELIGKPVSDIDYNLITSEEIRKKLEGLTFITATDGNHGRGVAWTAARLGLKCVVYMPRGTARERLENIKMLGADASITDMIYDDCVRKAAADADKNGWILMQDTSWDGYTRIPLWIMQGYMTMAYEAAIQLENNDGIMPTHIILQAGVGSMAAALAAFYRNYYRSHGYAQPVIIIIEPDSADCIYRTAAADDGRLHAVTSMHSIMAGLSCGEPCTEAWDIIHAYADFCAVMPDSAAADAMRILASPAGHDTAVISGESGAAGFGLAAALLADEGYIDERTELGLDKSSRILCISTEGATDRKNYRDIVWHGAFASVIK